VDCRSARRRPAVSAAIFALLAAVPAAAQYEVTPFADSYTLYVAGKAVGTFAYVHGPSPEGLFAVSWEMVPNPGGIGDGESGQYRLHAPTFAYFTAAGKPRPVKAVFKPMDAGPYDSGRARMLEADPEALYGYLGDKGYWAIPPRFAEARDFQDGYAAAREPGGLWGVIGPDGDWKAAPRFAAFVDAYRGGLFRFREAAGGPEIYWDAAAGTLAPSGDADPRSGGNSIDLYAGYSIVYGREGYWEGMTARYVDIASPDGKTRYAGIFTGLDQAVGKLGVVVLGYGGWYSDPQSYSRRSAAVGLFDLQAGKFLVPPICSQIRPIGATTWYVRPHGGGAYLYDAATGKNLGPQPDADIVWIDGQVALGEPPPDAGFGYPTLAAGEVDLIGFVNDDKVRLRAAPATTGAIVAELSKGTRLAVRTFKPAVETIGDWTGLWTKVVLEDGRSGWIFGYFVDLAFYDGL
jgi:hypothetical protein